MNFIDIMPKEVKHKLQEKSYAAGSTILYAEEENNFVYFLLSGVAEAYIQSCNGNFSTLYLYKSGSFFGEIEQFYDGKKPVEITALSDCIVKRLYRTYFLEWIKNDFNATTFLIQGLAEKLIINSQLVENILELTVKERLLRSISLHYHRNTLDSLNKSRLAKEVNSPIRSVNRAIDECKKQGLLDFSDNKFIIINPKELLKFLPYIE
ncbi:Crp/Fnr family transcriptional regulator [Clostridioides difficile]|nr:Crp/Fnr family transcriptional regulator [Clostridioides difficile]